MTDQIVSTCYHKYFIYFEDEKENINRKLETHGEICLERKVINLFLSSDKSFVGHQNHKAGQRGNPVLFMGGRGGGMGTFLNKKGERK